MKDRKNEIVWLVTSHRHLTGKILKTCCELRTLLWWRKRRRMASLTACFTAINYCHNHFTFLLHWFLWDKKLNALSSSPFAFCCTTNCDKCFATALKTSCKYKKINKLAMCSRINGQKLIPSTRFCLLWKLVTNTWQQDLRTLNRRRAVASTEYWRRVTSSWEVRVCAFEDLARKTTSFPVWFRRRATSKSLASGLIAVQKMEASVA